MRVAVRATSLANSDSSFNNLKNFFIQPTFKCRFQCFRICIVETNYTLLPTILEKEAFK